MRRATFSHANGASWGLADGDHIADVGAELFGRYADLRAALAADEEVLHAATCAASLGQMIFPASVLIAYCSSFTRLEAGDIILTGTPGSVGAKREPPRFRNPGDFVELEISNIGLPQNKIVEEVEV